VWKSVRRRVCGRAFAAGCVFSHVYSALETENVLSTWRQCVCDTAFAAGKARRFAAGKARRFAAGKARR